MPYVLNVVETSSVGYKNEKWNGRKKNRKALMLFKFYCDLRINPSWQDH